MCVSLQTTDYGSFWQGDDLLCLSRDQQIVAFQLFPSLTISLASSANEIIRLIVSPWQYLRLASESEWSVTDTGYIDQDYDCYRVSISPSDSGVYFSYVSLMFVQLYWFA